MEGYLGLILSSVVVLCGVWMFISPRSFYKVYALQLRGLVDTKRWTNPSWFRSLLHRVVGLGTAIMGYVFVWASWRAIHVQDQDKSPTKVQNIGHGLRDPWSGLIVGTALIAAGIVAMARPDSFVRLVCKYVLMLGEPTVEGIQRLRVFALVMATMAIISGGMLILGSVRILIS
jgi:hypothetical protein